MFQTQWFKILIMNANVTSNSGVGGIVGIKDTIQTKE